MQIIPSIIAKEFYEIEDKIRQAEGLVEWVQIDVCDGVFAGPATWPYTETDVDAAIAELKDLSTDLKIELHLMTARPEEKLDEWIDTPASRIFVHYEAVQNLEEDLMVLDMSTTQSGLSLKLDTPLAVVEKFIDRIDDIQLMSIAKLGHYGASFEEKVLSRIAELKKKYPKIKINVDGGISENNIEAISIAGATNAVVGSAIWDSGDVSAEIQRLQELVG